MVSDITCGFMKLSFSPSITSFGIPKFSLSIWVSCGKLHAMIAAAAGLSPLRRALMVVDPPKEYPAIPVASAFMLLSPRRYSIALSMSVT